MIPHTSALSESALHTQHIRYRKRGPRVATEITSVATSSWQTHILNAVSLRHTLIISVIFHTLGLISQWNEGQWTDRKYVMEDVFVSFSPLSWQHCTNLDRHLGNFYTPGPYLMSLLLILSVLFLLLWVCLCLRWSLHHSCCIIVFLLYVNAHVSDFCLWKVLYYSCNYHEFCYCWW